MKDVLEKTGIAYFDVSLRLTTEQIDRIIQQELLAQLHSPEGVPTEVLDAIIRVLTWYTPTEHFTDEDWRQTIQ